MIKSIRYLILLMFSVTEIAFAGENVLDINENFSVTQYLEYVRSSDGAPRGKMLSSLVVRGEFSNHDLRKVKKIRIRLSDIEGGVRIISEETSLVPIYYGEIFRVNFDGPFFDKGSYVSDPIGTSYSAYKMQFGEFSGKWQEATEPRGPVPFFIILSLNKDKYVFIDKTGFDGNLDIKFKDLFVGLADLKSIASSQSKPKLSFRFIDGRDKDEISITIPDSLLRNWAAE